jgi:acyl-CoA dehydrogenase
VEHVLKFGIGDDEREIFEEASRLIAKRCAVKDARLILNGGQFERGLWEEFGELGWLSVAIPEGCGGAGLSYSVLCGIAYELGRVLSPMPITSSIFQAAEVFLLGASEAQKQRYIPELAGGKRIATLALAERPGPLTSESVSCIWDNGELTGTKHAVSDADIADIVIATARAPDGVVGLFVMQTNDPKMTVSRENSIDLSRPLSTIVFNGVEAERLGEGTGGWEILQRCFDRAAVLIAFQQIGGAQACLTMARDYALIRRAFGRQIGSFQAIKHMLADVYIAIELAIANALHAATMMTSYPKEFRKAAAAARLSATSAFERAARDCIQTHGGIGVTWEHDANLFYRRSRYLAGILGGAAEWRDRLVSELERDGDE